MEQKSASWVGTGPIVGVARQMEEKEVRVRFGAREAETEVLVANDRARMRELPDLQTWRQRGKHDHASA